MEHFDQKLQSKYSNSEAINKILNFYQSNTIYSKENVWKKIVDDEKLFMEVKKIGEIENLNTINMLCERYYLVVLSGFRF